MTPEKINLTQKLSLFADHWNPRIIAELNGQHVKLGKFKGEFVWHKHENEDELFLVLKGNFRMELREKTIEMNEGDVIVIPKGVEHRPVAEKEVQIMLFEPASTVNTGNKSGESELTQGKVEWI